MTINCTELRLEKSQKKHIYNTFEYFFIKYMGNNILHTFNNECLLYLSIKYFTSYHVAGLYSCSIVLKKKYSIIHRVRIASTFVASLNLLVHIIQSMFTIIKRLIYVPIVKTLDPLPKPRWISDLYCGHAGKRINWVILKNWPWNMHTKLICLAWGGRE